MIRGVGKKEDPFGWLDLMEERLRAMEDLGARHITWFTHKNPFGCWICDMFVEAQKLIDSFREFLGPTPVDAKEEPESSKSNSTEPEDTDAEDEEEEVS